MKWLWAIPVAILIAVVGFLWDLHSTWVSQFPDQEAVISYIRNQVAIQTVDHVDRNTGQVPCYDVHGSTDNGDQVWVLATTDRVLLTLPDHQMLSKQALEAELQKEMPGFVSMRITPSILLPGTDSVDPETVQLNPNDTSWHPVWEIFGASGTDSMGSKRYHLIDIDVHSGQILRQFDLNGAEAGYSTT